MSLSLVIRLCPAFRRNLCCVAHKLGTVWYRRGSRLYEFQIPILAELYVGISLCKVLRRRCFLMLVDCRKSYIIWDRAAASASEIFFQVYLCISVNHIEYPDSSSQLQYISHNGASSAVLSRSHNITRSQPTHSSIGSEHMLTTRQPVQIYKSHARS